MTSELRDNGPYQTADQARTQFDNITDGIPISTPADLHGLHSLVLLEAATIAGIELSVFERDILGQVAEVLDSESVQVLAGLLIRARIAATETAAGGR